MAMTREEVSGALGALSLITGAAAEFKRIDVADRMSVLDREFQKSERALDREVQLLDRQIIRNERLYDSTLEDFENAKEEYKKTTGLIYKVPEKDSTDNVTKVLESLRALSSDIRNDVTDLKVQKTAIQEDQMQINLISDFYKGYGHDFSEGDPDRWDPSDFHPDELAEYIAERPELEGVDQKAFFEGVKRRGISRMDQVSQTLNAALDQAKTAKLIAASKQLEFNTKQENMPAAQIEQDIETIDTGVHSMLQSQANVLSNNFLAPARQALIEFTASQTEQYPEGDEELKTK